MNANHRIANHRIVGTRITVWDVLHHLENEWSIEEIADLFDLTVEQIQAAVDYIETHRAEVMKVHQEIEERNAKGNPPELEAKIAEATMRRMLWRRQRENAAAK